jgi:hypothetical protein
VVDSGARGRWSVLRDCGAPMLIPLKEKYLAHKSFKGGAYKKRGNTKKVHSIAWHLNHPSVRSKRQQTMSKGGK